MMRGFNKGSRATAKRIPRGSTGVELGVWKGDTSALFLKRAFFVHLVDAWSIGPARTSKEEGSLKKFLSRYASIVGSRDEAHFQSYYDAVFDGVQKRFADAPVRIWRMTTREFFRQWRKEKARQRVDWVYIDASHQFDDVLHDLVHSAQIVRSGGWIFGDDYHNKKGVKKAVDYFCSVTNCGGSLEIFAGNQFAIKR